MKNKQDKYKNLLQEKNRIEYELDKIEKELKPEVKPGIDSNDKIFRSIVENSLVGISIFQNDKIVYANETFSLITGYSFEELLRFDLSDILNNINPEFRKQVLEGKSKLLEEQINRPSEIKIKHKNGTERWTEVNSNYIEFNSKPAIQSMFIDITGKKKAEAGLIRTNSILQNLIKTSPIAIIAVNKDGRTTLWNPAAEKIFQWKEEEIVGKELLIIPENEKEAFRKRLKQEMGGIFQIDAERERKRKDGVLVPVKMSTAPLQDSSGEIIGSMALIRDITEERNVVKKLIETRERYKLIMEATNDAIWDYDLKQDFVWHNSNYADMLQYEPNDFSKTFNERLNRIYRKDQKRVREGWNETLKNKRTKWQAEYKLRKKSGSFVEVLDRAIILYDEQNNPVRAIGAISDISKIKKSQNKLKFHDEILKNVSDAIIVTDVKGRITFWNQGAERIFGYDAEEMYGRFPIALYRNNGGIKHYYRDFQRVMEGKFYLREIELTTKNNRKLWIRIKAERLYSSSNRTKGIVADITDITEQKNAIEALRKSELKYREMVENINDTIFVLDTDSKITFLSPAFKSMTGYSTKEMIGRTFRDIVYPDDLHILEAAKSRRLANDLAPFEFRLISKSGSVQYFLSSSRPIFENKILQGFRGVITDITDIKKTQKELEEAKEKAEQSDKLKSEFLAQVSHEIRTPLNTMLSFASLIKDDLHGQLDEELNSSFILMERAGRRIIRTIELILNISEIQTGTYQFMKSELDLYSQILFEITAEYKTQAELKGLKFNLIRKSDRTELECDEYTVRQIFENLVNNAVKYTESGKIDVIIFRDKNDRLCIDVIDTGIGISKDYITEIFEPFSQEDQGYTRRFEGNGLGLTLVKKYCEINNADVFVQSEKGKGSKFQVVFQNS